MKKDVLPKDLTVRILLTVSLMREPINFSDFSIICISFPICARANATFFSIKESVLADCLFFSVQDTHKVEQASIVI